MSIFLEYIYAMNIDYTVITSYTVYKSILGEIKNMYGAVNKFLEASAMTKSPSLSKFRKAES